MVAFFSRCSVRSCFAMAALLVVGGAMLVGLLLSLRQPPAQVVGEMPLSESRSARVAPSLAGAQAVTHRSPPTSQLSQGAGRSDHLVEPVPNLAGLVLDATGGPIAGARVLTEFSNGGPAGEAQSKSDGSFAMYAKEGPLRLTAAAEGYAMRRVETTSPKTRLELVLVPASKLKGRVLDAHFRRPLAGARVSANMTARDVPAGSTISDADGEFVLEGMPSGTFDVVAEDGELYGIARGLTLGVADVVGPVEIELRAAARLEATLQAASGPCVGASIIASGAQRYEAETGRDGRAEIRGIVPGRYKVQLECSNALPREVAVQLATGRNVYDWKLETGYMLSGRAETASGQPLADALISISPSTDKLAGGLKGLPARGSWCRSDERGHFECSGLVEGEYECTLMVNAERQTALELVVVAAGTNSGPIVLRADPAASIRVRLDPGSDSDTLQVAVFAQRAGAMAVLAQQTGSGYLLGSLPLGTYAVYLGPSLENSASKAQVSLQRDGEVYEIVLPSPEAGSIRGRVVGSDGVPLPDLWVNPHSTQAGWKFATDSSGSQLTDDNGFFQFSRLLPGQYQLRAHDPSGQLVVDQVVEVRPGAAAEVTLLAVRTTL